MATDIIPGTLFLPFIFYTRIVRVCIDLFSFFLSLILCSEYNVRRSIFSARVFTRFGTRLYRSRELSGLVHHMIHEVRLLSSLQILSDFTYHYFYGANQNYTFHLGVILISSLSLSLSLCLCVCVQSKL